MRTALRSDTVRGGLGWFGRHKLATVGLAVVVVLTLIGAVVGPRRSPGRAVVSSGAASQPARGPVAVTLPAIANPPPPSSVPFAGGKVSGNVCVVSGSQSAPGVFYRAVNGTVRLAAGPAPRVAFVITPAGAVTGRTLIEPTRPATFTAAYAAVTVPAVVAPVSPLAQIRVVASCVG